MCVLTRVAVAALGQEERAPLPDVATLMRQVEANQKHAEDLQKDYIYKSTLRLDKVDGKGDVKKTVSDVYEDFWLNGVEVRRHIEHDGKPLSEDEAKKENERIDKEVAKARSRRDKAEAEGKGTNSQGHETLSVARYLELGAFSNPRRETVNGRSTILVDFTGDPRAKTNTEGEKVVRDLEGTVWIDEQDKVLQQLDAQFIDNFKIFGGMVASVSKGTRFTYSNRKINDEVWLTDGIRGNGHVRLLLFFATDGNFLVQASEYRKFKATSKVLPTFTAVGAEEEKAAPPK